LIDKTAPGIEDLVREMSPAIRTPWKPYLASPVHKAVVAALKGKPTTHKSFLTGDGPLGALFADEAVLRFGAAALDSDFQSVRFEFALEDCCDTSRQTTWSESSPDLEGEDCPASDTFPLPIRKSVDYTVRWPEGSESEI